MMRHMKKMVCFLLAAIMMLAMCTTVMADEPATPAATGKITITNTSEGESYSLYKMLDLSVDVEKNAYSYYLNADWSDFFTTGAGKDYVTITTAGEFKYVTWKKTSSTSEEKEAFGKAAAKFVGDNNIKENATKDAPGYSDDPNVPSQDVAFDNLEPGYYLITTTNGTLATVKTSAGDNITIAEKTETPTIEKKIDGMIENNEDEVYEKYKNAQIGDTIKYTLVLNAKKGASGYIVEDVMDKGLTLNETSIQVKVGETELKKDEGENSDGEYLVDVSTSDEKTILKISFAYDYLNSIKEDTEITITYEAELNKDVVETNYSASNTATIHWGIKSSVADTITVYTYSFDVLKYADGDSTKTPIAGAEFKVYRVDGETKTIVKLVKVNNTEYRVADSADKNTTDTFTTVAGKKIKIVGVDAGKYNLEEVKAPAGYNKLAKEKEVNITDTHGEESTITVEIANAKGASLPETGGIGTTIFYVVGSVLVVGAAVLLITKKRMKAND